MLFSNIGATLEPHKLPHSFPKLRSADLPAQKGLALVRKHREMRPDLPVEDVFAQRLQCFAAGVNGDRLVDQIEQVVGHECQAADMVKMAMGEEHAPDALLLRQQIGGE